MERVSGDRVTLVFPEENLQWKLLSFHDAMELLPTGFRRGTLRAGQSDTNVGVNLLVPTTDKSAYGGMRQKANLRALSSPTAKESRVWLSKSPPGKMRKGPV